MKRRTRTVRLSVLPETLLPTGLVVLRLSTGDVERTAPDGEVFMLVGGENDHCREGRGNVDKLRGDGINLDKDRGDVYEELNNCSAIRCW